MQMNIQSIAERIAAIQDQVLTVKLIVEKGLQVIGKEDFTKVLGSRFSTEER